MFAGDSKNSQENFFENKKKTFLLKKKATKVAYAFYQHLVSKCF